MFDSIAAIDIGSSHVRMVLARKGFNSFQMTDLFSEPIDLSEKDKKAAVSAALQKLLISHPLSGERIVTNLPMENSITRILSFPFSDPEKIAAAVPFEAQENIPFDMDELTIDFQVADSGDDDSAKVMIAAYQKKIIAEYLAFLEENGIHVDYLGLEANALFECYSYFSKSGDERVIQIDIGYTKTIVNIITSGHLVMTRCIPIGTSKIIDEISKITGKTTLESLRFFERYHIDINDAEEYVKKVSSKKETISKPKLRKIHAAAVEITSELCKQINVTTRSFSAEHGKTTFDRILYSGSGSHISGVYSFLHKELGIHTERAEYSIASGTALSYLSNRLASINFLKGEFKSSRSSNSRKQYGIAVFFSILTVVILAIFVVISFILSSFEKRDYDRILDSQFRKHFQNREPQKSPIDDAEMLIASEKKELSSLNSVVPSGKPVIEIMNDVTSQLPNDPSFSLNNIVIDSEFVRFDGESSSGILIDEYKNKLIKSAKFESVNLNTSMTRKDLVNFSIVIKLIKQPAGGSK